MRRFVIVPLLLASLSGIAHAQKVTITRNASGLSVAPPGTKAKAGGKLEVTCAGTDCSKLDVKLGTLVVTAEGTASDSTATFPILRTALASQKLSIKVEQGETLSLDIEAGDGDVRETSTRTLIDLLRRPCGIPTTKAEYNRKANRAEIVVSPLGNVLDRPVISIDEDDQVVVKVWGDPDLLPLLRVYRSSPFRDPGGIRIVGAGVDAADMRRLSGQPQPKCDILDVRLGDFEPGKGVIDIAVVGADEDKKIGSVEIGIAPLYTGAFSFGPVWTKLANPTFGLISNGADSVIAETDDAGEYRVKYAIFYTPFFRGPRDLRKSALHINPTLGLVLNDVSNNVLVGASGDVLGMGYLSIGAHVGRVQQIDKGSGLAVGDVFPGSTPNLPVQRRWRTDLFVGASIDLRAAVQLLRVVLGAPAG